MDLTIRNVGLMSPGDMGQALAIELKSVGLQAFTALEHRKMERIRKRMLASA